MKKGCWWLITAVCAITLLVAASALFWPRFLGPWQYYYCVDSGRLPARTSDAERFARSSDPDWRDVACRIIQVNKDPAGVPLMLKLLIEDRDQWVRGSAAVALSYIDDPAIARRLRAPMRSMNPCERRIAVNALWHKSDSLSAEILCWMLNSRDEMDRLNAMTALSTLRGEANRRVAIRALVGALEGASRREVWSLSRRLAYLRASEAVPVLRQVLAARQDLKPKDRAWLEYHIGRLEGRQVDPPPGPMRWEP